MASVRLLKKQNKDILLDVLNRCDYHIVNETKSAKDADKLIDEAIDFHDGVIARVNAANTKKEFSDIASEVNKAEAKFGDKLKGLE